MQSILFQFISWEFRLLEDGALFSCFILFIVIIYFFHFCIFLFQYAYICWVNIVSLIIKSREIQNKICKLISCTERTYPYFHNLTKVHFWGTTSLLLSQIFMKLVYLCHGYFILLFWSCMLHFYHTTKCLYIWFLFISLFLYWESYPLFWSVIWLWCSYCYNGQ